MKTKDYIFIGMITIISLVIYMLAMGIASLAGTFGSGISPGIFGLLAGTIFVYICYQYPKKGIFTIYTIVLMTIFSLMGGVYLPWLVTSITSAIIADILLNFLGFNKILPQILAWSLMQLGSAAGQWIPIWFFANSFRKSWTGRGQDSASMDAMINYAKGGWGVLSVLLVFTLSSIGVLIGRKILKKYQKEG